MTQLIGPYVTGEKPLPLRVTFTDASGTVIPLGGHTAKAVLKPPAAVAIEDNATIDTPATAGIVIYTWGETSSLLDTPGTWQLEIWVGNSGDRRLASELFQFEVRAALAIPNI